MTPFFGPNETVDEVLPQIGALLIGARTYCRIISSEEATPYGGAVKIPQFVLTHSRPETAAAGFTFVSGDMPSAVEEVKASAVIGSLRSSVNKLAAVLRANLLDEILVHLIPLILGDGLRMFDETSCGADLEIIRSHQSERVTDLWYRVVPRGVRDSV
jgi:dihydrofolate reductase